MIEKLTFICDDTPSFVLASIVSANISIATLVWGSLMSILGQVPTPNEAGMWPFYGVLIVAVIVLFCSLAYIIRWVMTTGVSAISSVNDAVAILSASNKELTEALEKQSEFFDCIGKDAIKKSMHNENFAK